MPCGVTDEIIHIKYYTMLNANDLEQLKAKGISEKQIEEQLACFVKGFPFLEIAASASVEKVLW